VGAALLLQIVHGHAGAATVRFSPGLVMPLKEAEIVELPAASPVAKPVLLIVATAVLDEFHVTWVVMFCVLLS
jgi:hypothetical protein